MNLSTELFTTLSILMHLFHKESGDCLLVCVMDGWAQEAEK